MDITIRVKELDGFFLIQCDEESGLNLCGKDLQKLLFDFLPIFNRLQELNHGSRATRP